MLKFYITCYGPKLTPFKAKAILTGNYKLISVNSDTKECHLEVTYSGAADIGFSLSEHDNRWIYYIKDIAKAKTASIHSDEIDMVYEDAGKFSGFASNIISI